MIAWQKFYMSRSSRGRRVSAITTSVGASKDAGDRGARRVSLTLCRAEVLAGAKTRTKDAVAGESEHLRIEMSPEEALTLIERLAEMVRSVQRM